MAVISARVLENCRILEGVVVEDISDEVGWSLVDRPGNKFRLRPRDWVVCLTATGDEAEEKLRRDDGAGVRVRVALAANNAD